MKKRHLILSLSLAVAVIASGQSSQFSLATDVNALRSLKKDQRYWAVGQTVIGHFHFTSRDGAYAWISYFSEEKVSNSVTATAKSTSTTPQQIGYRNDALLRFKHISLGWKRYLKGTCDSEKQWNLYGFAGFGLMLGVVTNTHSVNIDLNEYDAPVLVGKANFKRLTLDLGLGAEQPVGADVFLYAEARALVPTTDYPSQYLFVNDNAPFTATANLGIRILFH